MILSCWNANAQLDMPRHWYRWREASYNICPLEFYKMSCWLYAPLPLSVAREKSEHKVRTNAVIEPRLVTGGHEIFQTEESNISAMPVQPDQNLSISWRQKTLSATKGQIVFLCNDWSRSRENIGWPWENHLVWVTGCIILLWMLYFHIWPLIYHPASCTQWLLRTLVCVKACWTYLCWVSNNHPQQWSRVGRQPAVVGGQSWCHSWYWQQSSSVPEKKWCSRWKRSDHALQCAGTNMCTNEKWG